MINFFKNSILIPLAIIVAGLLIGGAVMFTNQRGDGEENSSQFDEEAARAMTDKAVDFINNNMLEEGTTASLVDVKEENGLYKFKIKIRDQEYDSYLTEDGKILFTNPGINIEEVQAQAKTKKTETPPQEVPKTDTPNVKLFVMSYCPYGLQSQKMFLPVYDLLKEKAEIGIYFVDYIMHEKKEIDENLRQYCIQKEQKEKYGSYLSCFVAEGKFEKCLTEAGIDQVKMNSCVSQTDKDYKVSEMYNDKSTWLNGNFPKFNVQADLNEKYGVRGSPTVIINDQVVSISPRSPEKFKEVICGAFNSQPSECSQVLSEETSSPGFGV